MKYFKSDTVVYEYIHMIYVGITYRLLLEFQVLHSCIITEGIACGDYVTFYKQYRAWDSSSNLIYATWIPQDT